MSCDNVRRVTLRLQGVKSYQICTITVYCSCEMIYDGLLQLANVYLSISQVSSHIYMLCFHPGHCDGVLMYVLLLTLTFFSDKFISLSHGYGDQKNSR
jgi:hypothetical protein